MSIEIFIKESNPKINIEHPQSISDLQPNQQYVYCLELNDKAIAVGRGNKKRARVIFDNHTTCTYDHIKSFHIRLYQISSSKTDNFKRLVIPVKDKKQALEIEHLIHLNCGGQGGFSMDFLENLLNNEPKIDTLPNLYIKLAYYSAFSGLRDLRTWRNKGLIPDDTWKQIKTFLQINLLENQSGWN